jgi:hypothetical protein
MSGFFQFWTNGQRGTRAVVAAALLCLILGPGVGRALAQHQHGASPSGDEPAPPPKKADAKKASPDVVPPPKGISYSTRLDRTAVWVGDQFHYIITVDYTPEYDFESVLGNTTRETVNMDPFQVMDLTKKATVLKDGNRRLVVDLTLANFATGKTTLQVPQCTLYYFRKDRKTTSLEGQAAESLTVTGPVIGLRSTLPPNPTDIRDTNGLNLWERNRWVLPTVGMASLVLVIAGLGWEASVLFRRRKSRKGPDRRKAMEAVRARWASAVPSDFSDSGKVMEFYDHSYRDLREYLGHYLETPALGLTAEEMQEEMQRLEADPEITRKTVKVLSTCETTRYAQDGKAPDAEAARDIAQDIREILTLASKR